MSHFTRVKTQIRNLDSLRAALEDLNVEFEEDVQLVRVRGWQGSEELAQLCIKTGTRYDIGVRVNAQGEYELVADWWALEQHGITEQSFVQRILQRYAYHEVKSQAEAQGYQIEEEEVEEDGSIRIRVVTWQ